MYKDYKEDTFYSEKPKTIKEGYKNDNTNRKISKLELETIYSVCENSSRRVSTFTLDSPSKGPNQRRSNNSSFRFIEVPNRSKNNNQKSKISLPLLDPLLEENENTDSKKTPVQNDIGLDNLSEGVSEELSDIESSCSSIESMRTPARNDQKNLLPNDSVSINNSSTLLDRRRISDLHEPIKIDPEYRGNPKVPSIEINR